MTEEIFKDIPGYEGLYQVSDLGRVKSLPRKDSIGRKVYGRILKPRADRGGYLKVGLFKNGNPKNYKIHRLVTKAFIPNPENKPEVNHIDGNKSNNCVNNLEWCTGKENKLHAYKTGLNPNYIRPVLQFTKDNIFVAKYNSIKEAATKTNTDESCISKCCKHRKHRNTVGGYIWRYESEDKS